MTTVYTDQFDATIVNVLRSGGIGVLRTDTLYGIVASADNQDAVERVYEVKGRTPSKPPIILIASVDDLPTKYNEAVTSVLDASWPGKVSIILPVEGAPEWLTRGGSTLAYRVPGDAHLRELLQLTGPLIAPSANPEGLRPAKDMQEAVNYFGDSVDFYVDGGMVTDDAPSQLYAVHSDGTKERLR
ncbi:MAG TPA: L-threonylcarbamoyladenylate synthase [Candidatus Saccharimonadales bacterium]|nr:L-threonylcarbamoyladenylate synthase [Candidatus Saccharimonadales bacterium]